MGAMVAAGGLLSYGVDTKALYRVARFFALINAFYLAVSMAYGEGSFLGQYYMRGNMGPLATEDRPKGAGGRGERSRQRCGTPKAKARPPG